MNSTKKIREPLYKIAGSIVGRTVSEQNKQDVLRCIAKNSRQAVLYVSLIEDEFKIVIGDENINTGFFTSFDFIEGIVRQHICSTPQFC